MHTLTPEHAIGYHQQVFRFQSQTSATSQFCRTAPGALLPPALLLIARLFHSGAMDIDVAYTTGAKRAHTLGYTIVSWRADMQQTPQKSHIVNSKHFCLSQAYDSR